MSEPLAPKIGDYVLATKYRDGDPGDPWALGFYAGVAFGDRHLVKDSNGDQIRAGGYQRVGRLTPEIGNWLYANRVLLEQAPSKINLWGMYDWEFLNEAIAKAQP